MKLKFFVIGSCFSGYMFKEKLLGNYSNGNIEMVYQHQHDVFAGIMSKQLDMDLSGVTSKYQWDFDHFASALFEKSVIQKIMETKPDYIVIDTYAEAACPLVKINDESYITSNYYLSSSSIYEQLPKECVYGVDDSQRFELFKKYFSLFIDVIRQNLPETKIILVKARSTCELYDYERVQREIFSYADKVEMLNKRRAKYENYILENVEDIRCLDMTDEYELADTGVLRDYNYEVSHNHYSVEFYRREFHKLQGIVIADMLGGYEKRKYFNQAVCIRAYDDFPLLLLMAKIYKDFFKVYIHIDADSIGRDFTPEQISRLRKVPNVSVITKYKSPKNSYNEVLALIEITKMAFSDKDVQYIHYVTSMDMPIRSVNRLYDYYDNCPEGRCFLNCHASGEKSEMDKIAPYTYRYYHYFYNDDERIPHVKQMMDDSIQKQKEMGIFRSGIGEFTDMYKGVLGGSLTREAFSYCEQYMEEHPEYMEDIKFTRLRTEFFLHTILFNSEKFEDKITKSTRGSKFDWTWNDKEKDYAKLSVNSYNKLKQNQNTLFVRGVSSADEEVLNMILKDIKTPYKLER